MITEISIDGFRCFNHTHIKGFEQVNLLGGKNNSGKTALLEAIMLACQPNEITLAFLRDTLRKESQQMIAEMPNKVWDNLFYQQQDKEIKIIVISNNKEYRLNLAKKKNESNILLVSFNDKPAYPNSEHPCMIIFDSTAKQKYEMQVSIPAEKKPHANSSFDLKPLVYTDKYAPVIDNDQYLSRPFIYKNVETLFNLPIPNAKLAAKYNELELNSQDDLFLQALNTIDESIDKVKISIIGENILYARRKGEKQFLPLTLFGDAINSVAKLIFAILDAKDGILLIDEIENGIHYTNHDKVWTLLFQLAKQHNVQVFTTTHSHEMIEAFAKTSINNEQCSSAYFEMARHAKTNEIIGTKLLPDVLTYRLNVDKPLRGE